VTNDRPSVRQLLWGDYAAHCRSKGETPTAGLRMVARFVTNPSLHAVVLLRLANRSPRWLGWFWRNLLIAKHNIDWTGRQEIGPGLLLPHPMNIVFSAGVRIGANLKLGHNTGFGGDARGRGPVVGDNVHIYMGSVLIGDVRVGDNALIGAWCFVDHDVPARHVLKRDGTLEPLRDSSFAREMARSEA
jgi:serine acetyltransferase